MQRHPLHLIQNSVGYGDVVSSNILAGEFVVNMSEHYCMNAKRCHTKISDIYLN